MFSYPIKIVSRSVRMFMVVARIMVPVMLIVYIADRLGLVQLSGEVLAPFMGLLGLPAEAGIIWATVILTNIYAGMATMAVLSDSLEMTVAQVSALGSMMLFAHNVPTEQSIARKAGASALVTGALRLGVAALYSAVVCWVCKAFDWLQQPVSFAWMQYDQSLTQGPPDFLTWLGNTAVSLVMILGIIIVLVALLDVLERLGINRLITRMLTPILRLSGLEERAAPLTTVGVLLGLDFGGALIIDATKTEKFNARTRLLALSWLSLCHALIEDTILILALGADIWIILVIRCAVVLGVMALMARLTRPDTLWGRRLEAANPAT